MTGPCSIAQRRMSWQNRPAFGSTKRSRGTRPIASSTAGVRDATRDHCVCNPGAPLAGLGRIAISGGRRVRRCNGRRSIVRVGSIVAPRPRRTHSDKRTRPTADKGPIQGAEDRAMDATVSFRRKNHATTPTRALMMAASFRPRWCKTSTRAHRHPGNDCRDGRRRTSASALSVNRARRELRLGGHGAVSAARLINLADCVWIRWGLSRAAPSHITYRQPSACGSKQQ